MCVCVCVCVCVWYVCIVHIYVYIFSICVCGGVYTILWKWKLLAKKHSLIKNMECFTNLNVILAQGP
jgi:hypothetical protein